jgi:hypothetical protein
MLATVESEEMVIWRNFVGTMRTPFSIEAAPFTVMWPLPRTANFVFDDLRIGIALAISFAF